MKKLVDSIGVTVIPENNAVQELIDVLETKPLSKPSPPIPTKVATKINWIEIVMVVVILVAVVMMVRYFIDKYKYKYQS